MTSFSLRQGNRMDTITLIMARRVDPAHGSSASTSMRARCTRFHRPSPLQGFRAAVISTCVAFPSSSVGSNRSAPRQPVPLAQAPFGLIAGHPMQCQKLTLMFCLLPCSETGRRAKPEIGKFRSCDDDIVIYPVNTLKNTV